MFIGGKERPIKIGLNQSVLYCELRGCNLTDMQNDFVKLATKKGSGAELRDFIWSALKDGARSKKQEFNFDNFDVGDWIEEVTTEELMKFVEKMNKERPDEKPEPGQKAKKKENNPPES